MQIIIKVAPDALNADDAAKQDPEHFLGLPFDAWVAVFTGLLTLATVGLWWSTGTTVRLAREEFIAAHPPDLVVTDVRKNEENGIFEIVYHVRNIGSSRATIKENWIFIELLDGDAALVPPIPHGHYTLPELQIAPGDFCQQIYRVEPDELAMIAGGKLDFLRPEPPGPTYFIGAIEFADKNGRKRRCSFRYRYDRARGVFTGGG